MSNTKNSTATIKVASAIVFLVFVFCYIYCFQTDLLAFAQHVWSGGKTHWNGIVGASVITLILFLIHVALNAVNILPNRLHSLTYLPSFLLLAALTSIDPQSCVGAPLLGVSTWICCALFVLSVIFIKLINGYESFESVGESTSLLSHVSLCNFFLMVLMMMITMGIGNTDRKLHLRLAAERFVSEKKYDDVLRMVKKGDGTDRTMTMFCALALSKNNTLGEKFFEYPNCKTSRALLPTTKTLENASEKNDEGYKIENSGFLFSDDARLWRQLGAYPRNDIESTVDFLHLLQRKGMARKAVPDYILTAYLMDCDLYSFASEITKYYDLENDELPKHFKEALILYTHLHSSRVLTYHHNALDADYEDFVKIQRKKYQKKGEREFALKKAYQGTYWYYYYMNSRS